MSITLQSVAVLDREGGVEDRGCEGAVSGSPWHLDQGCPRFLHLLRQLRDGQEFREEDGP